MHVRTQRLTRQCVVTLRSLTLSKFTTSGPLDGVADRGCDDFNFQKVPFACREGTHSVLSILNGTHSIGEGFLGFLTMKN